ncbi:MAG: transposase family protein, partial [bacterium]|nr:transposase family protein [bacterium]
MSKPSRRPNREARKEHQENVKASRETLARQQASAGIEVLQRPSVSNTLCPFQTQAEEQAAREEAVASQVSAYRSLLPSLLKKLSKIPDPRQPKKVKHKLTVVLTYGLLMCVFQMASRRQANTEMSRPVFFSTLQQLFPELETLPHADTLNRLLDRIDVEQLEVAHMELVQRLIQNKKFQRYLIEKRYPIAIDGTQKLTRDGQWWGEEWLQREYKTEDDPYIQQYVYVLEANLVFHNGLTVPLLSEFLSYGEGDPDDHKQDCELKAFKRLAARLKGYFKRLPILLLLDG